MARILIIHILFNEFEKKVKKIFSLKIRDE
jgi:hypothetical protein